MRKLLASILAAFALSVSGPVLAGSPCAGISNCDDNQIQGQAQGQLQGQQQGQGQAQGQIGINHQNQNAYGGSAYGGNAHQGQLQGQIGINKNYNDNNAYSKAYGGKAVAVQGQLQGNKQAASNTINLKSTSFHRSTRRRCWSRRVQCRRRLLSYQSHSLIQLLGRTSQIWILELRPASIS